MTVTLDILSATLGLYIFGLQEQVNALHKAVEECDEETVRRTIYFLHPDGHSLDPCLADSRRPVSKNYFVLTIITIDDAFVKFFKKKPLHSGGSIVVYRWLSTYKTNIRKFILT